MFQDEKVYKNNANIKYYFVESDFPCNKLIVIYSGYSNRNSVIKYKYNYVRSLQYVNCHKLFILDDNGETGSYYLGEKLNFDVESSIISLILDTITYLKISIEDVISLGSSKGGTAALYYGLKYKFGTIISGAFQTKISDLISLRRPESEKFLLDDRNKDNYNEKYHQLNNIIFDQLNTSVKSNLYLMSSKNDWQYSSHVKPFLESLDFMNVPYHINLSEKMKNHSQISTYFPEYFNMVLLKELYNIEIKDYNVEHDDIIKVNISYSCNCDDYNLQIFSLINGDEYIHDVYNNLTPLKPGYYTTFLRVLDEDYKEHYRYAIHKSFNGAGIYEIISSEATLNNNELQYEIETTNNKNLTFAFYIFQEDKVLEFIPYQKQNFFTRTIAPDKNYKVKCYIKSKDQSKVVIKTTPTII